MATFKIGDTVESTFSANRGERGTVVDIDESDSTNIIYTIKGFTGGNKNGDYRDFSEVFLKAVPEDKFKKGSFVEILHTPLDKRKDRWNAEMNGMIGKICEIKEDGPDSDGDVEVWQPDKKDWWFFDKDDLKPVNEKRVNIGVDVAIDEADKIDRRVFQWFNRSHAFTRQTYSNILPGNPKLSAASLKAAADLLLKDSSPVKNKLMYLKTKIKLALMGEPTKTLVKAGVIDENKNLTGEGQMLFNDFLYEKFGEEFAAKIAPLVAEEKKS